jgi:hemoglobin-like flavoprotein
MNTETSHRLQECCTGLASCADELIELFFSRLFTENPSLRGRFPAGLADLKRRLLAAIDPVVSALDDPQRLSAAAREIGSLHPGLDQVSDLSATMRDTMVYCLQELSGGRWDDRIERDWSAALEFIGAALIDGARAARPTRRAA